MIRSFRDSDTEAVFNRKWSARLPHDIQRVALRKLRVLGRARDLRDLASPGNRLEKHAQGRRKGQYSIRINQQWRICFNWRESDAFDVEIVDYH
jgi:toxin HigB-1